MIVSSNFYVYPSENGKVYLYFFLLEFDVTLY